MLPREYVTGPMPLYLVHILGHSAIGFAAFRPKQGIVRLEISVLEKGTLRIKVWNGFFVAIMGFIARMLCLLYNGLGKHSLARLR